MSPLRDSTRARDLDRTNARWLLDAAYAEGQLGAGEYHDRIAQAASAATLRDLRDLTSDLQLPASVVDTHPVGRRSTRGRAAAVAAIVGVGLVASAVAVAVGRGESDSATPDTPVVVVADPDPGSGSDASPPDLTKPVDAFTAAGIDIVVDRYRFQFGDTAATSLALYPDAVRVTRAVPGAPGRSDVYELTGSFVHTGTEASPPKATPVELDQIDSAALARLIAEAPARIGEPAGRVEHVYVTDSGRPTVTVYVQDGGRGLGYVVAGLDGSGAQTIRAN
ncbi:DUF1707 SHOCT-like domain-containing protein [Rhodococcus gannanensis]|uniref:DUF1707 domain-containing protein n=1 Tax=Rhodococcus gannanensis TaxID=1960308 RepID=A0ABW4P2W8_9NOCA